jgi:threonine dehydratase
MRAAREAGVPVTVPAAPTLADGIAVRRVGEKTLPIVQRYVDEIATVDEEELAGAILHLLEREKTVAEGAGAAALAALLQGRVARKGPTACVVSGGNIDVNVLSRIIERGLVKDGRLVRLRVKLGDHPGELHRLLGVVAEAKANVMEIEHNRAFSKVDLDQTVVDLTIETRGPAHVDDVQAALRRAAYSFERL